MQPANIEPGIRRIGAYTIGPRGPGGYCEIRQRADGGHAATHLLCKYDPTRRLLLIRDAGVDYLIDLAGLE